MKVYIQASKTKIEIPEQIKNILKGKEVPVYVIAEEGISSPRILGEGTKTLTWPSEAVKKVAELARGVKLFIRHNKDNSHDGRKVVGRAIHTFTENNGKTKALAVMDMNEYNKDLDVCSIEADIQVDGNVVKDVNSVSGIALSSSNVDSPAFPGAKRLAMLQCFGEDIKPEVNKYFQGEKEIKPMTFAEVKMFIEEHNVYPRQLFSIEKLKEDREFGPLLLAGEQAQKELSELKLKYQELDKSSKTALRKMEETQAREMFAKLIPEGATEKQKAFYLRRFNPEKLEKLDELSLKAYLDAEAKEYAELAKILGTNETQSIPEKLTNSNKENEKENPIEAALDEVIGG